MMDLGQEEHEQSLKSAASANSIESVSGAQPRRQQAGSNVKARDDKPLVPQRPPKLPMSPAAAANRQTNYVDHVSAARAGSPALDQV